MPAPFWPHRLPSQGPFNLSPNPRIASITTFAPSSRACLPHRAPLGMAFAHPVPLGGCAKRRAQASLTTDCTPLPEFFLAALLSIGDVIPAPCSLLRPPFSYLFHDPMVYTYWFICSARLQRERAMLTTLSQALRNSRGQFYVFGCYRAPNERNVIQFSTHLAMVWATIVVVLFDAPKCGCTTLPVGAG